MLELIAQKMAEEPAFAKALAEDVDGTLQQNGIALDQHERSALQSFVFRYGSADAQTGITDLDPDELAEPWTVA